MRLKSLIACLGGWGALAAAQQGRGSCRLRAWLSCGCPGRRRRRCPPAACCFPPLHPQQARAAAAPADDTPAPAAPARVRAVGAQGQGGQHMPRGAEGRRRPWRRLRAHGCGAPLGCWVLRLEALHAPHSRWHVQAGACNTHGLCCPAPTCALLSTTASTPHGPARPADEFFRLHEELRFGRAPLFDVPTALHILQTGVPWGRGGCCPDANAAHGCWWCPRQWRVASQLPEAVRFAPRAAGNYRLLPAVIEEELVQPGQRLERPGELGEAARAAARTDALRRLDFLLRSKLLAVRCFRCLRSCCCMPVPQPGS